MKLIIFFTILLSTLATSSIYTAKPEATSWIHLSNNTDGAIKATFSLVIYAGRVNNPNRIYSTREETVQPYDVRFISLTGGEAVLSVTFTSLSGAAKGFSTTVTTDKYERTRAFVLDPSGKTFKVTELSASDAEKKAIRK